VLGFSEAIGEFTEDTFTAVVNRGGARIRLKQKVIADDEVRIINLQNHSEADFRVVGPTNKPEADATEWGVECTESERNIWGIEFPPPLGPEESGALLECRACKRKELWALRLMQVEVLDSTGEITGYCDLCRNTTFWTYAEVSRRPREFSASGPVMPTRGAPPKVEEDEKKEKRTTKRLSMHMPILVLYQWGEEEVSRTENVSKRGVAVRLAANLPLGTQLDIICPYSPEEGRIWQKGEVRRRDAVPTAGKRSYGIRYVR
jgi:hypothetical protein